MALIECVPNFSEGRDAKVVDRIAEAVSSAPKVRLLDRTSDVDHNRSVLTFAGEASAVADAAFRAVRVATAAIRLPEHAGVHPRIGSTDVVPFVPIEGVSIQDCAELARALGRTIWDELGVPVYLYEAAAFTTARAPLERIRSPRFTGEPDFGTGRHPTAGAVVVGARRFLVAWNINLESRDVAAAQAIARAVRESSGGLPRLKALGLPLASRGQVQVSMNLTDFEVTPLHAVFARVAEEARQRGIRVAGSELIGLIPRRALELSDGHDLQWENLQPDSILEERLKTIR